MNRAMNIDTRVSRRTVLRGLGVTVGLPLLESIRPLTRLAAAPPAATSPVRTFCLFMANGVNPRTWTPEGVEEGWKPAPALRSLESVREHVSILSGLSNKATRTGDGHYVKTAGWLTGTTITKTTGSDLDSGGVSMDQVAAQRIGHLTRIPSLELGVDPVTRGVDANVGYTRLYGSHISWSTPTTPLAREIHPRRAFDRLFRSEPADRRRDSSDDRSVLDLVRADARTLRGRVGRDDRRKLDEYLQAVRAVEKRIDFDERSRREEYLADPDARREIERLGGALDVYSNDPGKLGERSLSHQEHVRLMLDIAALAFWTDTTRVGTFMFGNAVSGKNFSFLDGVSGGHHQISHHENKKEKLEQYTRINAWHVEQFVYLIERLRSMREGEGTVLDNAMVLFGSGLRDGNSHSPVDVPVLLGGRGGGTILSGRHLAYPKDTPLCNLYRSMLRRMGTPVASFADSTGELAALEGPRAL